MDLHGQPLLQVHLERVSQASRVDATLVAITDHPRDNALAETIEKWGYPIFRGSEDDVLSRFFNGAQAFQPQWVVRVTSDCPFVDPKLIDEVIEFAIKNQVDYASNTLEEAYPDGQDIEVFRFEALTIAHHNATLSSDREHVTPYLKRNSDFMGATTFKALSFPAEMIYNHVRLCVDEPVDLEVARKLAYLCGLTAGWQKYTETYLNLPEIKELNQNVVRNEGYLKSLRQDGSKT